ncbi:ABC transporter ATP-binding protein [Saccharopolyspora erythraea]|uniref:ATP-binding cassette domain-containing protein n=1 Tax=Saccharopolyspora erythraea TaxID=1836 RepID=UPI001BA547E8|nr:ABC transporter ATP-binding protein [Saccharopolyspora erythraea]QUH02408.1 ABC transporter ATP-binding protein [Saccharopolyspora erythraea]
MTVGTEHWRALAGRWRACSVLAAYSLLEALPALLSGGLVQRAVDDGFAAGDPLTGLAWLSAFAAAAVAGAFGVRLVWQRLGTIVEPLRDALVRTVVRGVLHDTAPPRGGPDAAGVARITQHVEVVRDATAGLLVQARGLVVSTAAALVGIASLSGTLAWLAWPPVVVSVAVFLCLLPALARRQRGLALADEATAAATGTVLAGMRDVVACGGQDIAEDSMRTAIRSQADAAVRMSNAAAVRTAVVAVGGFLPVVLVLAAAPGAVAAGELTAGAVLGTLVYLTGTLHPALHGFAATASTVVVRLLVALDRLGEVRPPAPPRATAVPAGVAVRVRGLTHRWGEHAEPVLRDFDIDLTPGDHLAVVGPSGIGKSTLASLLTGTVQPCEGRVLVGGVPVAEIDPAHRHRLIAFTPQESYLFAGSARENLALLAPRADDAHLMRAASAVGADALLDRLGGLDAALGHAGAGLSAGERQLLGLARVFASPARIVVLDEATAHLDGAAEARAERAFAARGGVLVVIAHRLASARRADRILVMDGRRAVLGEHEQLLVRSRHYADMTQAWAGAGSTR